MRKMEAPKEVDFLSFQRKLNTFLGMPFYVNSTKLLGRRFGEVLTVLYQNFTEVLVIVMTVLQFWAVPHVFENMNVLCGCLSSSSHSLQLIVKTTLLRFYKNQFLDHINYIHSIQKDSDEYEKRFLKRDSFFEKYYLKQTEYIRIIVTIQLLVNFISTNAYFLPIVYDSISDFQNVEAKLTPIVMYLPMNFNFTPLLQSVNIFQTISFYIINLKTVVLDNFILSLIALHMSQLKYHKELLKEIIEKEDVSDEVQKDLVRGWIKQDQALSRSCLHFRQLISPYLFIEFFYVFVHTCIPSFVITSTFSWTLPQKVAVFCIIGGGLTEVFLMCSAGAVFSDVWRSIGDVLFQYDFFFKNKKWMKTVHMMIQQKTEKPFSLGAFKVIPLNRGTFASILRLIFSYYMTLNQIQKIKHEE